MRQIQPFHFLIVLLAALFFSGTGEAQVRSQGKVILEEFMEEPNPMFSGPLVDYKSEMRQFIQNIARYGRQYKRGFIVIVKDANGLLQSVVDPDQLIMAPSSVFIEALDGVLQPALSYGKAEYGEPTDEKEQEEMMESLKIAKETGLEVLTVDYVSKPADVDKAFQFSKRNGFIPYAAPGRGIKNNHIANWPPRPTNENSHNITHLSMVKNFLYISDSSRMGSREEFAMKIHNTNFDMIITDVFHHRDQALTRHNVETMQHKKLGSRRPVLAKMNIGFADVGGYYWQDGWREGNPSWIYEPAPMSVDQHMVQYWNPAWQQIIYGNENSYLYGIIRQGFDGVVIEGAHVHELFENPL